MILQIQIVCMTYQFERIRFSAIQVDYIFMRAAEIFEQRISAINWNLFPYISIHRFSAKNLGKVRFRHERWIGPAAVETNKIYL